MPSRITVAVCQPMAGVGGFMPEGTWFLAISGILVFALVFILEARLLWSLFDWHNGVLTGSILQGFLPGGRVSPCTSLFNRHIVYFMYWFVTVFLRAREGVGVISPNVTVTCVGWELLVGLFD